MGRPSGADGKPWEDQGGSGWAKDYQVSKATVSELTPQAGDLGASEADLRRLVLATPRRRVAASPLGYVASRPAS
jgi:hypothetical protein